MPRVLDYAIGGWDLSGIMTWRSGFFVRFGGLQVNGDPIVDNPTPNRWFNTAGLQAAARVHAAHQSVAV